MALLEVNFVSKSLARTETFNVILPADKMGMPGQEAHVNLPFKTLYLLHGGFGNYTDYISGTRIQRWAEDRNLAVIMPSGGNQFYIDKDDTEEYFGAYVGQELVEFTRTIFPLSDKREDTFIAGLSMGGYGALVNGLKYSDNFGYIGAFSAALILNDVIQETDFLKGFGFKTAFYERVLGKRDALAGTDKDYCYLIEHLQNQNKTLPEIYLAIGKDDFLYEQNQEYRKFLQDRNVSFTYEEGTGGHEWDFWDTYLNKFLNWLPLEAGQAGRNSGNVKKQTDT